MRILIVDDSTSKLAAITLCIREVSSNFEIETCTDCSSCLLKLKAKYDLLILDLVLPIRGQEEASSSGARIIINQIQRDKNLIPPTYIVGLTQFEEQLGSLQTIWPVITYNPSSLMWKESIIELLNHIAKQENSSNKIILEKRPTIYVEGKTDHTIISKCIELFYPQFFDKVIIKSEKNSGAAWVVRQIIVWAHSLPRDENENYIKCIGLFDNDKKGVEAIQEINRIIPANSAEANCFKTIKYQKKHAKHLVPIFSKGLTIPITLEHLFSDNHWKFAEAEGWLETQNHVDTFLNDPKDWDKVTMSMNEHLKTLNLTFEENLYLKKINIKYKVSFIKYILDRSEDDQKKSLLNVKTVVEELLKILFPGI
jgi:CheY-like chemotaxis protein